MRPTVRDRCILACRWVLVSVVQLCVFALVGFCIYVDWEATIIIAGIVWTVGKVIEVAMKETTEEQEERRCEQQS